MKELTKNAILLRSPTLEKKKPRIISILSKDEKQNSKPHSKKGKGKLCINTTSGSFIISISDIQRLDSASNYTCLYTLDAKKHIITKTMKALIDLLPSDKFIRCHNSHYVNIDEIISFRKTSLTLRSNIEIPISRQRYSAVAKSIESICIPI